MSKPFRIVILDDQAQAAKDLAASLSSDGVVAYPTQGLDEARELISLLQHDVLLIDVEQLVRAPIYALQALRQVNPDLKIVGMARGSCGDGRLLRELLGLDAYLQEPVTPEALITCVPEIADRYLMVAPDDLFREERGGRRRQERPTDGLSLLGRLRPLSP